MITGEQYVGSSTNLAIRVRKYFQNSVNPSRFIAKNINKYGIENFKISLIVIPSYYSLLDLKRLVVVLEQYYIIKYNPLLNIVKIAGGM